MKKAAFFLFLLYAPLTWAQKVWTLEECIDYAIENNLTIQQSKINEDFDEINLKVAKNKWVPTLEGYFDNSFIFGANDPLPNEYYQLYENTVGLRSSIPIFGGGRLRLNKKKAKLDVKAGQLVTETNINDISLLIINYYLNVVLNRELLQISRGNLEISKSQLERIKTQFEVGTVSRSDLVQAEANLAQENKNVADAKIEVDRALFNLAMLLQLPDYRDFDVRTIEASDDLTMKLYNLEDILDIAYSQQPNIKRAEAEVKASEMGTRAARASYWPTLTGTYALRTHYLEYMNEAVKNEIDPAEKWFDQWRHNLASVFGLSLNIPILNNKTTRLNVQQSLINQDLAQNVLNLERQQVRENVQLAYFDVNSSYQAYEAARESVRSNATSFDFAERSFKAGVLNIYDYEISRNNLAVARSQMAQAKYTYVFRLKVLEFYAGIPLTENWEFILR